MDAPATVAWAWPAEPNSVPAARHQVMAYLRERSLHDPPLSDVGLVVSEAVTNVVNHAYVDRPAGEVRVGLSFTDDEVAVMVEDDGSGMRPRPDTPGLGLGLPVIATVADRVETRESDSHGTVVRAWFARDPSKRL